MGDKCRELGKRREKEREERNATLRNGDERLDWERKEEIGREREIEEERGRESWRERKRKGEKVGEKSGGRLL